MINETERQERRLAGPELSKQERKTAEKTAASLNKGLRGMLAAPIDYNRDLLDPVSSLWRFVTDNGQKYITRQEGSGGITSVGTIIKSPIQCTHVIKNRGGWRTNPSFFPLIFDLGYLKNFNVSKAYKNRASWIEATLRLNSDSVLEGMLRQIPTAHERWTGRSVVCIPDEGKNPLTATGQLVPHGDLTLAALIYISEAGDGVEKCVKALQRISALIGSMHIGGEWYGPALGWDIIHDLRGDVHRGLVTERLLDGWPLLARAHAIQAKAT